MRQREINANLGGINSEDFDKYINFINILIKKKHQNGNTTENEIKIDKVGFNSKGNFFNAIYGWQGDDDREQWLEYEYKTLWSFSGGYNWESDWEEREFGSIPLEPPYVKKPFTSKQTKILLSMKKFAL
jgi:hypothetical protein